MPRLTALPSKSATRLFTLLPGSASSPVQVTLSVVDLKKTKPHFEAISYTWGNGKAEVAISVDGARVNVRTNLHQCLLRLRHRTKPRILWCDFLCINQTDLDEKAQQVQMFGKIFQAASRVLVWLGEHADHSEELFQPWSGVQATPGFKAGLHRFAKGEIPTEKEATDRRANIWVSFFHRPYWRRTWIVQELQLAREIIIHVGPDSMDYHQLIGSKFNKTGRGGVFDRLKLRNYNTRTDSNDPRWLLWANLSWIDKVLSLDQQIGQTNKSDQSRNIFEVVDSFQNTLCFDPHDKVYALHWLETKRPTDKSIEVDYRLSLPELVISLYACRYVYSSEPKSLESVKADLQNLGLRAGDSRRAGAPQADGLVASLGLDKKQCDEIARLALARSQTEAESYSKRWKRVSKELPDAFKRVTKEQEYNNDMLEGKAYSTRILPGEDEKLYWLERQKK